jgi:TonB family protein
MGQVAEPLPDTKQPARDLRFLVASESWPRVFLQNLSGLFSSDNNTFPAESAAFWPDVFVDRSLPWGRFLQSGAYHILALALVWAGSRFLALKPRIVTPVKFERADVIYYTPSEYLPPLDTRNSGLAPTKKADPEYSAQPIISVPPEADNHSQTVVTPPNIHLDNDVALPNVVALLEKPDNPRMPIGPAPAVPVSDISRIAPQMERSVVAPPPELQNQDQNKDQDKDRSRTLSAPQAAVIAPPPDVSAGATRRIGDLNIGHSSVIAPAPQLALDEQRSFPGRTSTTLHRGSVQVVAPPPSLGASGRSRPGGSMIALSLHPGVGAPPVPPAGNRRGGFAATPEGHRGASGAPGSSSAGNSTGGTGPASGKTSGSGSGTKANAGLPSGLYVGKAAATTSPVAGDPAPRNSSAYSVNPNLIANVKPPRLAARGLQSETESKLSQEERAVFGNRKFYSLSLNMPNLNSAGGSWIIRFAALQPDGGPPSAANAVPPELSSPVATRKVDPAYPLELMRQNLGGTVILYAVIYADGTVGSVRVLRSIDDRLDQYASEAIAKWQFQPATKNGAPVDVEATFWIPFRPMRVGTNF